MSSRKESGMLSEKTLMWIIERQEEKIRELENSLVDAKTAINLVTEYNKLLKEKVIKIN
jgi:hypothetical protein